MKEVLLIKNDGKQRGYDHLLISPAVAERLKSTPLALWIANVIHETPCSFLAGAPVCNCYPDIEIVRHEGS